MTIEKYGRYFAVREHDGTLVCLTVYKRGAEEVVRRLSRRRSAKKRMERRQGRTDFHTGRQRPAKAAVPAALPRRSQKEAPRCPTCC